MKERILLFRDFPPWDFDIDLPINLGRNVTLDEPYDVHQAMEDYPGGEALFLQEQAGNLGQVHVVLRAKIATRGSAGEASDRIWLAMTALRLAAPLKVRTSAILTFFPDTNKFEEPSSLATDSVADHNDKRRLTGADLDRAREINRRLGSIKRKDLVRVRSALTLWAQISIGMCSSWQLSTIGLIASIEALFPQPKNRKYDNHGSYGERLSARVGRFLGHRLKRVQVQRLCKIYKKYRNPIAHGVHDPNQKGVPPSRYADLYFLHEVSRLVLLGMLSKSNQDLADLLPVGASDDNAQRKIDAFRRAPSELFDDQGYIPRRRSKALTEY